MKAIFKKLWQDEDGFIVSAELVLVSTITVLSMIVGLTELSHSINNELYDVADAFDSVNQWNRSDRPRIEDDGGLYLGSNDDGNGRWDVVAR